MTEIRPSQLELMRMHVEALYTHDDLSRIGSINQWNGGVAPRFFFGRTKAGNLWRFRTDVPDDLAAELENLCSDEPSTKELARAPVHREEYARLLSSHMRIEQIWTGPAYWLETDVVPSVQSVEISEANANLLRGGLQDWLADVPHRRPFMAMIENDHAVSVCASVRITRAAHAAGVETLPAHRRKGHAANVVAAWANAVRKLDAIPLYSTSWDNSASQALAARLGSSLFGVDFHIT